MRCERLAEACAVGGQMPGEERVVLREAGAGAEGLLPDGAAQPLGQPDERGQAAGVVDTGSDDERRALGAADQPRELATAPPSADCGRTTRRGAARSPVGCLGGPVVHRHDHERRLRAPWPPRGTPARSRRAHPAARPGSPTHTGYSPPSPRSLPARNGSAARCRRSCWPTTTTSGARLARAVASAPTALPRPAVVWRTARAGRAGAERPAGGHADDRALVQAEHEAELVGEIREERDLGRPRIREQRGEAVLAEDVEGRVADGSCRHGAQAYTQIICFFHRAADDAGGEDRSRRRCGRRRSVDGLQPRADPLRARARARRQPAGDGHVARRWTSSRCSSSPRAAACAAATRATSPTPASSSSCPRRRSRSARRDSNTSSGTPRIADELADALAPGLRRRGGRRHEPRRPARHSAAPAHGDRPAPDPRLHAQRQPAPADGARARPRRLRRAASRRGCSASTATRACRCSTASPSTASRVRPTVEQAAAAEEYLRTWYVKHVALDSGRSSTWTSGVGVARMVGALEPRVRRAASCGPLRSCSTASTASTASR